ncbi:MAG: winged helix-turn-helix transcriptional regulator [Proteobacteria bacterium]|nr:winged helix-turn-helix transcriptional regulator [Pseudomonadota bacterium]
MDALSTTFAALADPTRRAILARLARGPVHVGALVEPFPISGPAISRHLRVLQQAGLIERETNAQWRICRLHGPGLRSAHDWFEPYRMFWEESLERLAELLEAPAVPSDTASSKHRAAIPAKSPQRRRSRPS